MRDQKLLASTSQGAEATVLDIEKTSGVFAVLWLPHVTHKRETCEQDFGASLYILVLLLDPCEADLRKLRSFSVCLRTGVVWASQ